MMVRTRNSFGWRPIISSGFGFCPFALQSSIRKFYERWHANGGQSARDCAGIVKRARDLPDFRNYQELQRWGKIQFQQQTQRAAILTKTLPQQVGKPKASVTTLKPR